MPPLDPEPNDEEKLEQISPDEDTPLSLPTDTTDTNTPPDPQSLDPNLIDEQELYDEGINLPKRSSLADQSQEGFDIEPKVDEV